MPREFNKERIIFSINGVGITDNLPVRNYSWALPPSIQKNYLETNQRSKCKSQNYKSLKRKYRSKSLWPWVKQSLPSCDTKATDKRQTEIHQKWKHLYFEQYQQKSETTTSQNGETICISCRFRKSLISTSFKKILQLNGKYLN